MLRHVRTLLVLALLALAAGSVVADRAAAADSHAPRGARADWLPMDEWVMSGWLPYDEVRLEAELRSSRAELAGYLDDRRSLWALARRRHVAPSAHALAVRLVAPRRVGAAQRRVLVRRAEDTLTQPHLARHVLFHLFHTSALAPAAPRVFGLPRRRFLDLRDEGLSPVRIAARGGRSHDELMTALQAFFAERGQRAVRLGAVSPEQAAHQLELQTAGLSKFTYTRYRTRAQQAAYARARHRDGHAIDQM